MKNIFRIGLMIAFGSVLFTACNDDMEQFIETPPPVTTMSSITDTLASPARANDSLYYRLIVRAGMTGTLDNLANRYTVFVPNNDAMKVFINAASGGAVPLNAPNSVFSTFIQTSLPAATAAQIIGYNTIPQAVPYAGMTNVFPNFQYPSMLNPAPAISSLLRLTTFPSPRNGNFLNNIPVISADIQAGNGYIHEVAAMPVPPSQFLWDRINTDPQLTYLKAAILRADSGTGSPGTLQAALLNIGANLTVYAPTDAAMQQGLTFAIYTALVQMGVPTGTAMTQATALASTPAVFSNPALYPVLTAQVVKGIVVYHLMQVRAFNNNLPTTAANFPTLLNSAFPGHPGIALQASFTGPIVSAATVKGMVNPTASNILINPNPGGTSDQNYLNGVLHKIDQVLLPQ